MNKLKIIVGYILAFISMILVTVLVALVILKVTLANKNYVKDLLESNNYYSNVSEEILDKMKYYMASSGLPENILEDIYSKEDVKEDINLFIDNAYIGSKTDVNVEKLVSKLNSNIDNYVSDHKVKITSQNYIDSFVKNMTSIYEKEVNLYGIVNGYLKYIPKIIKLINQLLIICGILLLVNIVGLVLLKVGYISSIFMASALIIIFVRMMFYEKIDYHNILIISSDFSNMVKIGIDRLSFMALISSICLFLIGILLNLSKSLFKK